MTTPRHRLTPESARRLTLDTEPWLSCEDCFEQIDIYIELLLTGTRDQHQLAMRTHLAGCNACEEEARSLLLLVAAERNIDAEPILPSLASN
ncbi:MAG: hypothetical protein ABI232_08475 [Jatrophihabitantaceae bacterium]